MSFFKSIIYPCIESAFLIYFMFQPISGGCDLLSTKYTKKIIDSQLYLKQSIVIGLIILSSNTLIFFSLSITD